MSEASLIHTLDLRFNPHQVRRIRRLVFSPSIAVYKTFFPTTSQCLSSYPAAYPVRTSHLNAPIAPPAKPASSYLTAVRPVHPPPVVLSALSPLPPSTLSPTILPALLHTRIQKCKRYQQQVAYCQSRRYEVIQYGRERDWDLTVTQL
jgi:hypothetical protein